MTMKRIEQLELEAIEQIQYHFKTQQIQYHFKTHMKRTQMFLWPYFILTLFLMLFSGLFIQIILLLLLVSFWMAVKNMRLALKDIETLENLVWSHMGEEGKDDK